MWSSATRKEIGRFGPIGWSDATAPPACAANCSGLDLPGAPIRRHSCWETSDSQSSHWRGPTIYLRSGKVLVTAPLPSGQWRVGVALPPGDPLAAKVGEGLTADRHRNSASVEEGLASLRELYADYSGDSAAGLSDPTWISIFRIHRRMASTFRSGRALIAGDAAHLTSPLGGQGVNTGLNDAFNLGWKLALVIQGRADERLIYTYEAERRPTVERIDRATAAWTSVLFGDSVGARFVRRWIALPSMRWRPVQAWVLTRRGALQSSYRGGSLARDAKAGWLGRVAQLGPQAGDGAPDVECRSVDSEATTVGHEIGPNWGLIVFGPMGEAAHACQAAARERLGDDLVVLGVVSGRAGDDIDADRLINDPGGKVARAYAQEIQADIKAFFGSQALASAEAQRLLFSAGDRTAIRVDAEAAVKAGLGGIRGMAKFRFASSTLPRLPARLRVLVGCAVGWGCRLRFRRP